MVGRLLPLWVPSLFSAEICWFWGGKSCSFHQAFQEGTDGENSTVSTYAMLINTAKNLQWNPSLGGGFKNIFFYPYWGKISKFSNLTNMFQRGWNHQLVYNETHQCIIAFFFEGYFFNHGPIEWHGKSLESGPFETSHRVFEWLGKFPRNSTPNQVKRYGLSIQIICLLYDIVHILIWQMILDDGDDENEDTYEWWSWWSWWWWWWWWWRWMMNDEWCWMMYHNNFIALCSLRIIWWWWWWWWWWLRLRWTWWSLLLMMMNDECRFCSTKWVWIGTFYIQTSLFLWGNKSFPAIGGSESCGLRI